MTLTVGTVGWNWMSLYSSSWAVSKLLSGKYFYISVAVNTWVQVQGYNEGAITIRKCGVIKVWSSTFIVLLIEMTGLLILGLVYFSVSALKVFAW